MKHKILFKILNIFICVTELGNIVAIEDTEDNRNPDIGPLTKMGVTSFEKKEREHGPAILTADNMGEIMKQVTTGVQGVISPVMERLNSLKSEHEDLEKRFKMLFDELEAKKAEAMLEKKNPENSVKTLVSD